MIERVESGSSAKRKVLEELGMAKSTYYRWRAKRSRNEPLTDGNSGKSPWNRFTPQEAASVLDLARRLPEFWHRGSRITRPSRSQNRPSIGYSETKG